MFFPSIIRKRIPKINPICRGWDAPMNNQPRCSICSHQTVSPIPKTSQPYCQRFYELPELRGRLGVHTRPITESKGYFLQCFPKSCIILPIVDERHNILQVWLKYCIYQRDQKDPYRLSNIFSVNSISLSHPFQQFHVQV